LVDDVIKLLLKIKELIRNKCYRVKIHTVRHMIEEGFSEKDIVNAILEDSKIIELYEEDKRCLILGQFNWNGGVKSALHIVCDYSNKKIIDFVTAYIPQRPWWESPTRRGRR
jgi:hypothetical protein